ncbi:MAG: PTS sugar transporter subunit IIA [Candidatus Hydrogenedentes bacterium]|nr:PTS sugar transporter subunit IIA [Candidatus Hydrogenedentota bacterium]
MSAFGIEVNEDAVRLFSESVGKHDALDILINAMSDSESILDREAFRQAVHEREAIMSTGIGSGIAIPHVRIEQVLRPIVGIGISQSGIDFGTLDDEPVHIVVLFAMPAGSQKEYLNLLAQVMLALKQPGFREELLACQTPTEVAAALNRPDA